MPKALVLGGATGLLGRALTRVLSEEGWGVETLGRADGDVTNSAFLAKRLAKSAADVVFNAVAWTRVDDAEERPRQARLLNCALPDTLAHILKSMGQGHLVHFSTDFVFSGQGEHAWREDDTPAPLSIYGLTKLAGERAVLKTLPGRACVLRTAWLFGPGRKNFVQAILHKSRTADSVEVVFDQTGSPTYTLDLARWSLALAAKRATGIWHAVNSEQANWAELAAEAIALAGGACQVIPITSEQWPQKARRPAWSVLDATKLGAFLGQPPRPWPQALRDYLHNAFHTDDDA
jgi:dTDP-4-dehydrorhamnose reductase